MYRKVLCDLHGIEKKRGADVLDVFAWIGGKRLSTVDDLHDAIVSMAMDAIAAETKEYAIARTMASDSASEDADSATLSDDASVAEGQ